MVRLLECDVWELLDQCVNTVEAAVRRQQAPVETAWRVARVEVVVAADDTECRYLEALLDGSQARTETGKRVTAKAKRKR